MHLDTLRLFLRPIKKADKELLFAYRSEAKNNKYQGWIPNSLDDVDVFIDQLATEINTPNSWYQLAIIEKLSNQLIGDIGIHFFDNENQQVEIGCTLHKTFQGKGYATEALTAVIDYLFNELKKHRIIASVDPRNTPSIAMMERLGFRKEAHFKKSLLINNEWVDDMVYATLRNEWRNNFSQK